LKLWPLTEFLLPLWVACLVIVMLLIASYVFDRVAAHRGVPQLTDAPWLTSTSVVTASLCAFIALMKWSSDWFIWLWLSASFWLTLAFLILIFGFVVFAVFGLRFRNAEKELKKKAGAFFVT